MPAATAKTVKYIFYDAMLSLIGGICSVPGEEKAQLRSLLAAEPGDSRPVWPGDMSVSLEMAGFVNGYCLRYADWGDAQRPPESRGGHPSDMCAALAALCSRPGLSGKRALEALHVGYQLWVWVQNRMMYKRPELDPTTYLSLTLPVMTALCMDYSPEMTQNVLNLSASSGTTLLQVRPHDITNLKCGATGYAIARAFWLCRMGSFLKAPGSMFEGKNGWNNVVAAPDGELEAMEDDEVYGQIQVKALPCCNVNQASTECAIRLHGALGGNTADVESVVIRVSPTDAGIALKPGKPRYPFDHPSADHHMNYCFAAALKYGALTPLHYAEEYYGDPELRRLMDITRGVVLRPEELDALGGGKGPCMVELKLRGGRVLTESAERPAGYFVGTSAAVRCAGLEKAVETKRRIIESCYGYDLSGVEETVMSFETCEARQLVDSLRGAMGEK